MPHPLKKVLRWFCMITDNRQKVHPLGARRENAFGAWFVVDIQHAPGLDIVEALLQLMPKLKRAFPFPSPTS